MIIDFSKKECLILINGNEVSYSNAITDGDELLMELNEIAKKNEIKIFINKNGDVIVTDAIDKTKYSIITKPFVYETEMDVDGEEYYSIVGSNKHYSMDEIIEMILLSSKRDA